MKKIVIFLMLLSLVFGTTGCSNKKEEKNSDAPAGLKEIIGEVSLVTLDSNGDIIISKDEVTEEIRYYSYIVDDVSIGLFAIKDSNGNIRILINTCQSCGGSPYAYFVQVNNKIQCQNCGNLFEIDSLGEITPNSCSPIGIKSLEDQGDTFKIDHEEIEQYKDLFENWQGPKA